jgi:Mg-chelatase subunit ChlD
MIRRVSAEFSLTKNRGLIMAKDLRKYDFVVAIDKSGSMARPGTRGLPRWKEAEEAAYGIASKAAEYDDDGITVVTFSSSTRVFDNVTAERVEQVFSENDPGGTTDTAGMLRVVFDRYNASKRIKPVILVVVTDGEPDDRNAVKTIIRDFAATLTGNGFGDTDDFGILFLQVGNDPSARSFLKELDTGLNARFDIVATRTVDELSNMTMTEAFIAALED